VFLDPFALTFDDPDYSSKLTKLIMDVPVFSRSSPKTLAEKI